MRKRRQYDEEEAKGVRGGKRWKNRKEEEG